MSSNKSEHKRIARKIRAAQRPSSHPLPTPPSAPGGHVRARHGHGNRRPWPRARCCGPADETRAARAARRRQRSSTKGSSKGGQAVQRCEHPLMIPDHGFRPLHMALVLFLELHKAWELLGPLVPRRGFLDAPLRDNSNKSQRCWTIVESDELKCTLTSSFSRTDSLQFFSKSIGLWTQAQDKPRKRAQAKQAKATRSIKSSRPPRISTCRLGSGTMKPSGI